MNPLLMIIPGLIFSLQSASFKLYAVKCEAGKGKNAFFRTIFLAITAIIALAFTVGTPYDSYSILYGAVLGVCFYFFIKLYNEALVCGPMSYTVFIFSMNMIVPIIASVFMYHEYPTVFNYIGFGFLLIAIYFMNYSRQRTRGMEFSFKWIMLCLVGTLCNGCVGLMSKIYPMQVAETNFPLFIAIAFTVATILSCTEYFNKGTREELQGFKIKPWFIIIAVLIAFTNFGGNTLYTMFASFFDAGVYFPTVNGSSMIISLLISTVIFREKIKGTGIFGMLMGVIAIMLLSI